MGNRTVELGPGQQEFFPGGTADNPQFLLQTPGEPAAPIEYRKRIDRLVTFSEIEKGIYEDYDIEPKDLISKGILVGSALDYFLVLANFIYRHRAKYCLPDKRDLPLEDRWDMEDAFGQFYRTGYKNDKDKMLTLLHVHRDRYTGKNNPLRESDPVFQKRGIKERLTFLWKDVGRQFGVDTNFLQGIMKRENGNLSASTEVASNEGIHEVENRILNNRFYSLIDDDKDYSYVARPDFLIEYKLDGKTFCIQVQPDYIKRLRSERKSVRDRMREDQKQRIVAQRIVGDFKDTQIQDLRSNTGPLAESMETYNWFLSEVAQRGKMQKAIWIKDRLSSDTRKVFIFSLDDKPIIKPEKIEARLTFLHAEIEEMDFAMAKVTPDLEKRVRARIDRFLRRVA